MAKVMLMGKFVAFYTYIRKEETSKNQLSKIPPQETRKRTNLIQIKQKK